MALPRRTEGRAWSMLAVLFSCPPVLTRCGSLSCQAWDFLKGRTCQSEQGGENGTSGQLVHCGNSDRMPRGGGPWLQKQGGEEEECCGRSRQGCWKQLPCHLEAPCCLDLVHENPEHEQNGLSSGLSAWRQLWSDTLLKYKNEKQCNFIDPNTYSSLSLCHSL